nr:putative glycerol kinase 5 [Mirounga angustirostris]
MLGVRALQEQRRPEQSAAGQSPARFVLGLDVGSSVIRCHVYDHATLIRGSSVQKIENLYPQAGWVEIDPDVLWLQFVTVIKESVKAAGIEMNQIVGLGISTQRATFITWNKKTGNHFHNFISWQDLRAVELIKSWNNSLIMKDVEKRIHIRTLLTSVKLHNSHPKAYEVDSSTYGEWISRWITSRLPRALNLMPTTVVANDKAGDHDDVSSGGGSVRVGLLSQRIWWQAATRSKVNFQQHLGTMRNTGMVPHEPFECMCFLLLLRAVESAAKATEAQQPSLDSLAKAVRDSRTALDYLVGPMRIQYGRQWQTVKWATAKPSRLIFEHFWQVADQQSAMFGECCFHVGDVKLTMGTGTFLDINTGNSLQHTIGGFYPLIGWKIGQEVVCLAESNAGDTGTIIKWAQELDLFTDAAETEKMAKSLEDSEGVCFVPSFSGLQAPLNDPCACASFMGLKASTNKYHLVRAILESIAFRNKQLYELMQKEIHIPVTKVRADGGVCKNNFVMQMTSDLINVNIERPINLDMSCLGAAFLAGLAVGFWTDKEELKKLRQSEVVFKPQKKWQEYEMSMENWVKAVKRSMNWYNKM